MRMRKTTRPVSVSANLHRNVFKGNVNSYNLIQIWTTQDSVTSQSLKGYLEEKNCLGEDSQKPPISIQTHGQTQVHIWRTDFSTFHSREGRSLSIWPQVINLKIETEKKLVQGTLSSSGMHALYTDMTSSIYRLSPSANLQKRQEDCVTSPKASIGLMNGIHYLQTS